ncbi:hypothetical protein GCM10009867_11790 [Pedococcus aerophilus]|uniref:Response regulatory domain-containing protein n=1 Tax=Pedococcus aerophilus TaxID=436356 RepID=A0ABN3UIZ1_9MICO
MAVALVVDDDADIRHLVSLTARMAGYDPVAAESGEHALALLAGGLHPAVIVLDVVMPGVTGLDVCRSLRREAFLRSTPIVFLSAMARPEDRQSGLDAGADRYVIKPFSPRTLAGVLEAMAPA